MRAPSPSTASLWSACGSDDSVDLDYEPSIKVTINTLLGGAFLLDVDPMTSVRQVKIILSQMQGIPISQQSLVFQRKTLRDDALLSRCGVKDGSSLSLVLGVNSALTNVMATSEPIIEPECATDLFEADAMDMLDITGMSDGEQDELLSLLFGHSHESNDKQGFILCRDGEKISMLHLGASLASSGRNINPSPRPPLDPATDHNTLQQRLQRLQENTRHRIRMTELQIKSQQRKDKRSRRSGRRVDAAADSAKNKPVLTGTASAATPIRVRQPVQLERDHNYKSVPPKHHMEHGNGKSNVQSTDKSSTTELSMSLDPTPPLQRRSVCLPAIKQRTSTSSEAGPAVSKLSSPWRPPRPIPPSPLAMSGKVAQEETPPASIGTRSMRRSESKAPHIPNRSQKSTKVSTRLGRSKSAKSASRSLSPDFFSLEYRDLYGHDSHEQTFEGSFGVSTSNVDYEPRLASRAQEVQQQLQGHGTTSDARISLPRLVPTVSKVPAPSGPIVQKTWSNATSVQTSTMPLLSDRCAPSRLKPQPKGFSKVVGTTRTGTSANQVSEAGSERCKDSSTVSIDRCVHCNRRLKIASTYNCRCGGVYCAKHRHSESHACSFDYKTTGRQMLAATNTKVEPAKLPKL